MSLPRYPAYRDSGLTWLGTVPRHWAVYSLKRELDFLTSGSRGWAEHYADDGALFIRIGNLTRDSIGLDLSDIQRVAVPEGSESERTEVKPGDILFSITAYLGSVAVVPNDIERAFVSQHVALARLKSKHVLPVWAAHVAASRVGKMYLETRGYGGTKVQLSLEDVAELVLPVPPIPEQATIATFIDRETSKIDALIAEQEKLITLLAEKRQATISHAVTKGLPPRHSREGGNPAHALDPRLRGGDDSVPMKASGVDWLGEVPAHWNVTPLKYLASFKSGGTPSKEKLEFWDGDVPWASAKDLKSDRLSDTEDHITAVAVSQGAAELVPMQSVLVVVRGMILAKTFPVTLAEVPMAINQDLKAVIPGKHMTAQYLAWMLRGTARESLRRLDEAGHGTKALRMDAWGSMQMPLPPRPEQAEILDFIERETVRLDRLRDQAERAITLLKERRAALIAAAVTGQIDVRGAVV